MPVSLVPIVFPTMLLLAPLLWLAKGRQAFIRAGVVSASLLLAVFLYVYLPGWIYTIRAAAGDRAGMYELARWTESHDEQIGQFILWPVRPDVLGGYAILEKAANLGYPPAIYALGVRLKHGFFVPRPAYWDGPEGNCFSQPERGQPLIDQAIELGYLPVIDDKHFYFGEYRY